MFVASADEVIRSPSKLEGVDMIDPADPGFADTNIIGFVDIDRRPPRNPSDNTPRPYLSDLAVCASARRRGNSGP